MRDSVKTFVEATRSTVMAISFGMAFFVAVMGTAFSWIIGDGFGPGAESHERGAWQWFMEAGLPIGLFCGLIALPGVLHCWAGRRDARLARERELPSCEDGTAPRRTESARARQALWTVCMCYGAAYGAVAGAFCGMNLSGDREALVAGAVSGVVLGTLGACIYAAAGTVMTGRMGWGIAGILGGAVPTALGWLLVRDMNDAFSLAPSILLTGLIGAGLGLAVARGLHGGQSRVPGVMGLVEVIQEAMSAQRSGEASGVAAEVAPAAPPVGRGDETSPGSLEPRVRGE
jgi:hypothetical protein